MQVLSADWVLTSEGWRRDCVIRIGADGRVAEISNGQRTDTHRDCLIAAPVNAHSHAFQRAMAGLSERRGPNPRDTFWSWRRLMYRFLDQIDPNQLQAIATYVQMEMLEAGYATVAEFHYLHHGPNGQPYDTLWELSDRTAAAAQDSGIGLTLLPVFYQYSGCDRHALSGGQLRFGNNLERFSRLCEGARTTVAQGPQDWAFGTAPHSLRAVAAEDLTAIEALASGGPIHMHLAEQQAEVDEVQTALGARPVEWVLDNIGPNSHWNFVHCTQMQPHETIGLARSGAQAVLCPITEANLGDGIFDGVNWLAAGGATALGSDSNIRISLTEEIRQLDHSQRLRDHSRAALAIDAQSTGRRIFDAICAGGANAAGRDTGALQVGQWADIIALDMAHPDMAGLTDDTILDAFIFARDDRQITDVWSAGRHVVTGGQHIHHDKITSAYLHVVKKLRSTW